MVSGAEEIWVNTPWRVGDGVGEICFVGVRGAEREGCGGFSEMVGALQVLTRSCERTQRTSSDYIYMHMSHHIDSSLEGQVNPSVCGCVRPDLPPRHGPLETTSLNAQNLLKVQFASAFVIPCVQGETHLE